ncbi:MAG: hypothetical protein H6916_01430 [Novosphingobium sp.]|uniref:hypothetical protein n=1 Tax=Novosphingobium sp. TaxID=1874826 RepID=UPI002611FEE2|nr:hypothetical protein [Novosphingobium sp.]MCP5385465.1 hypothetical protein [Novosphingobium sp.]
MNSFYMLQPGRWTGLTEFPPKPGWPGSSPALVTGVQPLKTGLGQLQIDIVQPLFPGGGRRRRIIAKVVQKTPMHITCLFKEGNESRTAIMAEPNFAWLDSCCPELQTRRPLAGPAFIIDGECIGAPSWEEYLAQVFGDDHDEVLCGANKKSFQVKLGRMPTQRTQLMIDQELEPFDSALVSRGFKPHQMEDKWFILHDKGRLLFRRSWTGILIYDVEAYWRGDRLYLGQAWVNRKPSQYGETDDAYDALLLQYIIDVVLRGVPAEFPVQWSEALAPLQAWSAAGAASLS